MPGGQHDAFHRQRLLTPRFNSHTTPNTRALKDFVEHCLLTVIERGGHTPVGRCEPPPRNPNENSTIGLTDNRAKASKQTLDPRG